MEWWEHKPDCSEWKEENVLELKNVGYSFKNFQKLNYEEIRETGWCPEADIGSMQTFKI